MQKLNACFAVYRAGRRNPGGLWELRGSALRVGCPAAIGGLLGAGDESPGDRRGARVR